MDYSQPRISYFTALTIISLYFLVLNLLFPMVSDDFWHIMRTESMGGVVAAIDSFWTWNARTGEILLLLSGDMLNGVSFDFFNTIVFTSILYLTYQIIYVRRPNAKSDWLSMMVVLTVLMLGSIVGAVFLWRAGAFNYALPLSLFLGHFVLFRYYYSNVRTWFDSANKTLIGGLAILSFAAGMGSFDMGAVGTLIHSLLFAFALVTGRKLPVRYVVLAIGFITGFLVLYFAPGTQVRAEIAGNTNVGELLAWLFSAQVADFFAYSLLHIGKSMFKTNYMVAVASLAAVIYSFVALRKMKLVEYRKILSVLYTATITVLFAFLVVEGTMAGDAIGAVILVANGLLAFFLSILLLRKPEHSKQAATLLAVSLLSALLFIDIASFVISGSPTRRAYFFATYISALIITVLVTTHWKRRNILLVFAPIFSLGVFYVSLATYGLYKVENERVILPARFHSSEQVLYVPDYAILNTPQFYGWDFLAQEGAENSKLNARQARYYGVAGIQFDGDIQQLGPVEFIKYLSSLSHDYN